MSIDLSKMPKIGFGLMRLPETDGKIDIEKVCRMVDGYMNAGFTYFDTAYVYHGGNSEKAVKEAIVKRYPRDAFTLATKLPACIGCGQCEGVCPQHLPIISIMKEAAEKLESN